MRKFIAVAVALGLAVAAPAARAADDEVAIALPAVSLNFTPNWLANASTLCTLTSGVVTAVTSTSRTDFAFAVNSNTAA